MISPANYEKAITSIKLMCGRTIENRQYTFAEIAVDQPTDTQVRILFHVPENSNPRDETDLLLGMGTHPVTNALASWENVPGISGVKTYKTQKVFFRNDLFDNSELELSESVFGKFEKAQVLLEAGRYVTSACWSHDIKDDCLFIPTANSSLSSWRLIVITMQGNVHNHGRVVSFPLNFRFDLCSAKYGVVFNDASDAMLITRFEGGLPFHDLYVENAEDHSSVEGGMIPKMIRSIGGAKLIDKTEYRFVTCWDIMFNMVVTLCGCFINDNKRYPGLHVPVTLYERDSRDGPIVVQHSAEDKFIIEFVKPDNSILFKVNILQREIWNGATWLTQE